MRVLLIHNRYLHPGGEDAVFEAEKALLEQMGHEVAVFVEDNARLKEMLPLEAAAAAIWSRKAQARLQAILREFRPEVCHFHNTFLMISPAAYYVCSGEGVLVVQTLHNYRLVCPGALLMRKGRVCEDCVGKAVPWPGVLHGCWRGSRMQTAVVTTMLTLHRALGTWTKQVDFYIALTEFARRKFIQGGLPPRKIVVKPNFVHPDPGMGRHEGQYALFVGRLSAEKEVRTLLSAWKQLKHIPLHILGDGPLMEEGQRFVAQENLSQVAFFGRRPREEVLQRMQEPRLLVFPAECYENFPVVLAEAFATGLPVVASRLGAMAEIVDDGRTGVLFEPGNPEDLAAKVAWAWEHPKEIQAMGREARREFEAKYTAERSYEMLMQIYRKARAG